MIPLMVLVISIAVFWLAGLAGVTPFRDPGFVLRAALAIMFCLTASAHWGKRRPDLIRMVPPGVPWPDRLVTITGALEILGAVGLLVPATARVACLCLAILLVSLFPANVYAARQQLTIGGKRVPTLPVRGAIQVIFIATLIAAAWIR
jgi:uncharacterized membrane protein